VYINEYNVFVHTCTYISIVCIYICGHVTYVCISVYVQINTCVLHAKYLRYLTLFVGASKSAQAAIAELMFESWFKSSSCKCVC